MIEDGGISKPSKLKESIQKANNDVYVIKEDNADRPWSSSKELKKGILPCSGP